MLNLEIVTIDGYAGSGKSTVAKKLAQQLKFIHLNSGLLYRALGLEVIRNGLEFSQEAIGPFLEHLKFDFILDKGDFRTRISLNNQLLDEVMLMSGEASHGASQVGLFKRVREKLTEAQRNFAREYSSEYSLSASNAGEERRGIVLEGRDAGTVVFPDAKFKFFLDASLEERARRRLLDEQERGSFTAFEELLESIRLRDETDSNREFGPLKIAVGAEVVITDNKTVDEVVEQIFTKVHKGSCN